MFALILLTPLLAIFTAYAFSNKIGSRGTWALIWLSTFFSFLCAIELLFLQISAVFTFTYVIDLIPFFYFSSYFDVSWAFKVDYLSTFIIFLIILISFFIQTFSATYIRFDASYQRFILFISFFSFSILLLIFASNLLVLFAGWEIVGLASFLLINFWYNRQEANWGAFKAFSLNRVGDAAFISALVLFFFSFGTFEIDALLALSLQNSTYFSIAFLFLVFAAFAKSAQFFFHTWLPDAMEGPTPVSALLHSATIVTAGVYLLLRFSDFVLSNYFFQFFIAFTGLLTSFYAAFISTTVLDAKHSTAYTTLGQLGFMFFAVGSLAFSTAIFHLFIHGFYKSFAFLENAIELFSFEDEQDGSIVNYNSFKFESFNDIFGFLVFLSVNAIPLASSSVSKELLVFSGFETISNFFAFFFFSILFIGFMDSTWDDNFSDYNTSSFTYFDSHIGLTTPFTIHFSYFFLGLATIFIVFFTEDLFITLSAFWADFYFVWLPLDGSFFLILPFFSTLVVAFFSPLQTFYTSDNYSIIEFFDQLFYYERFITNSMNVLFAYFFWFFAFQIDKGFINHFFVNSFVYIRKTSATVYEIFFSSNFFLLISFSLLFCLIVLVVLNFLKMRFPYFDYIYVKTFYNTLIQLSPPKYIFLRPLPPIFFVSKSNKFFSIAIFYSYSLLFQRFHIRNYFNDPLIEDYKLFLSSFAFSNSSSMENFDSATQQFQLLSHKNSFTLFKNINTGNVRFPHFFFFVYYSKVFYYSIFSKRNSFANYSSYYFLPFYVSPFYLLFLSFMNSFFDKKINTIVNFFFSLIFFFFQLFFIFISPIFFVIYFIKLGFLLITALFKFFFNPLKFFLQNFYSKFIPFFSSMQWIPESFVENLESSQVKNSENLNSRKNFSSSSLLNDPVDVSIKSTENVRYKTSESADSQKRQASFFYTLFNQFDLFFFSIAAKIIRNYELKPFFLLNYIRVNTAFQRLNKRVSIFLYEAHALDNLRGQLFPHTRSKSLYRNYWFFNSFSDWSSTRTYPFVRFKYFLEFANAQISYYLHRLVLNFKQLNSFLTRVILFSFFRNKIRYSILRCLRFFVLSFFASKDFQIFMRLNTDKMILSFEKPYFYAPAIYFYTALYLSPFSFKKIFYTPFSVFQRAPQFYKKIFLSRLLSKKTFNLSFSTYLIQNNLASKKFSFDPFFQIFTNYATFNTFFPIFSYVGFDYLYDKNIFRDRNLLDKPTYEEKALNTSSSAEFYDFNAENLNSFNQLSNRTDRTTFHDFISVDSFTYYEDFSHLTYFFGYYTDFFFKFVFWPKIIAKNIYLSDTYFYFYFYFSKALKKNTISIFLFYILYLDIFSNLINFTRGFFFSLRISHISVNVYNKQHALSHRLFTIFFFRPIKHNFLNFYNAFFYYSNSTALLGDHFEITEEERSFDLGHNSEDFSTLADVDRFQFEEDITTDYTNHLIEEQYYSTYVDDEDFRFPEFNAFDAYVFGEEVYEPTYIDDELQIALDFAYEAEFGTFFNIFEEAQYQDFDESIYEAVINFLDNVFFTHWDKEYLSTFYIQDDTSVEGQDDSLEDIFDPALSHETEDASNIFVSKKTLTTFKNYTLAYEDYITKWLALNKTSQIVKYKKLPPFLYGIGRYSKPLLISNFYKKIVYGEKNVSSLHNVFSPVLDSPLLAEAIFKQFLNTPHFITKRFSNETKLKHFFLTILDTFNLPIFLFPKDPYLTNFILTQQICKYFGASIFNIEHFAINSHPIKTNRKNMNAISAPFSFFFQNVIDYIFPPLPLDKPTRVSEYYFDSNRVPTYNLFSFIFNSVPYFFQRYIFRDNSARILGGNLIDYDNPFLRNTTMNENAPEPTIKLPRIDEWLMYQAPSVIDLPHPYLVEPTDRLWYTIYFSNQLRGYKTVNQYHNDFLTPRKINVFRPLVYIRSLRKFVHEDEIYSYAKRLRRRLYEIRHSNKYPFIKDGYRIAELLDPKTSFIKKFRRSRLFYFTNFETANDWTGHPEFKSYQALSNYLNPEFSQLVFPNFVDFFSSIRFYVKHQISFSSKIFKFTSYRRKNFFRRRLKKFKLLAALLFSSFSPFITFELATAPYKFGINFETFYYVRNPALKDPVKFIEFEDVEESPYIFFAFFNSFFNSFQYYRVLDTFLFPYQYTFPFGNFFYDHEVFDLDEDENQEFSSFDFYVLDEPDSETAPESFESVENDSGAYSELVDVSYDDEFDDTAAFYDLEKDMDNSTASDNQPVLGTTFYDNPIPDTGSEKADVTQSVLPFDSNVYDDLYVLNDFVEFDEGYHNVSRLEYYEIALLEELICQLYEKYINVLETYPVDFFPPKTFNWASLSYKIFETGKADEIFRNPKIVDHLFDEMRPDGQKYQEVDKKYFWAFGETPTIKTAHLQAKINRFNRKRDRRILSILNILQRKYAKRYPKTLDPYYFRRFELFLDDFFNLPEFGTGRYFNIFKIHLFSNEISEAEIFDWFEDNNLDYHNLTLTDFFENIDFENDNLDPDAFEFWAETTTPIARFFFGYARSPSSGFSASDNRFFFNDKLNLSDQNYATPSFPFSRSTTALNLVYKSNSKRFFSTPIYKVLKQIICYILYTFKAFFTWYYYYCFLMRPEIQLTSTFKGFYMNHFSNYDRYYSHQYFFHLYNFLKKWDTNFNLTPDIHTLIEHEYFAALQNPSSYTNTALGTNLGSLSPYLTRLFSYFAEPEFEYYLDEFFLDNEQISNLRSRSFNSHTFIDYNSKSNFANILNTFFFWNYDELFYEELVKFFDETGYDENLLYTHSPMYTSEFLPEASLDEAIDFAPFIEELYAIDAIEFDSRITIFFEFLYDFAQTYFTLSLDYFNSIYLLSSSVCQAIFTSYDRMWLQLFVLYGPVTFFVRAAISFSFFSIFLFYTFFIIPYLIFFYIPFTNYFLTLFTISIGLFITVSCLFYAFSKLFRNFYKTLSTFEFEVFFLTLIFCWFEHVYWGNHIYPVNTTEVFDNPLINASAETDLFAPYQTLHYRRLGEKTYNSYFMSPYHMHLNVRQYRQVLRSFIFSSRVNTPELYLEILNERERFSRSYQNDDSDIDSETRLGLNKSVVFYPDYTDLFSNSDLPIHNFNEWTQFEDGFYIDFLNRGIPYIFTFDDFKKVFWELFLPFTKPYYVHQHQRRTINEDKKWVSMIRRYHNLFALSFGNNSTRTTWRYRKKLKKVKRLQKLPGRLETTFHYLSRVKMRRYVYVRRHILQTFGARAKLLGPNIFPHQIERRSSQLDADGSNLIRRFNRYSPFYNISPSGGDYAQYFNTRDVYSPFPYTISKFLQPSEFSIRSKLSSIFENKYHRFPFRFFKNSNSVVEYRKGRGGLFVKHYILDDRHIQAFGGSIFNRFKLREKDASSQLAIVPSNPKNFREASNTYENAINLAAEKHVKKSTIVKSYYYKLYRSGGYTYSIRNPRTSKAYFSNHFKFSTDFNTLYYYYSKRPFKIFYNSRTFSYLNPHILDSNDRQSLIENIYRTVKFNFYTYWPFRNYKPLDDSDLDLNIPMYTSLLHVFIGTDAKYTTNIKTILIESSDLYHKKSAFSKPNNPQLLRVIINRRARIYDAFRAEQTIEILKLERYRNDVRPDFKGYLWRFINYFPNLILDDNSRKIAEYEKTEKVLSSPPDDYDEQHDLASLHALYHLPNILEPMHFTKLTLSPLSNSTFFQSFLLILAARRNANADRTFKFRQQEKTRLDFNRFIFNKKDFFSRFSFYDVSPIYTSNSPLSKLLINDFFGFDFYTRSSNNDIPPVSDPFSYYRRAKPRKFRGHYVLIPTNFHNLYNFKGQFPLFQLNSFEIKRNLNLWPNVRKVRFFKEAVDLWLYHLKYFYDDDLRFHPRAFNAYSGFVTSETLFTRGPRQLRQEIFKPFTVRKLFGLFPLSPTRTDEDRLKFHNWSVNIDSKLMRNYFELESFKYEFFTRYIRADSPYSKFMLQFQPPFGVKRHFKHQMRAIYRYPFYSNATRYRDPYKFALRRPEEPTREREEVLEDEDYHSEIETIQLNLNGAVTIIGSSNKRRWETIFHRIHHATAFRAFFEYPYSARKPSKPRALFFRFFK